MVDMGLVLQTMLKLAPALRDHMLLWMKVLPTMSQATGGILEPGLIMQILVLLVDPTTLNQSGPHWDVLHWGDGVPCLLLEVVPCRKHPCQFMINQDQVLFMDQGGMAIPR